MVELAIAYYERGTRNNSSADLNKAIDLLGGVLRSDPSNRSALFNRALIEEEFAQIGPAISDLERLISIETTGPWSDEARTRLKALRDKRSMFLEREPALDAKRFDEIALDAVLQSDLLEILKLVGGGNPSLKLTGVKQSTDNGDEVTVRVFNLPDSILRPPCRQVTTQSAGNARGAQPQRDVRIFTADYGGCGIMFLYS